MADAETVEDQHDTTRAGRGKAVLNWTLALLTVPLAALIFIVAIAGVMSTAGCTGDACTAPGSFLFGLLLYGAPVVAVLAIILSFFTARRSWGIAVPLCALALLAIDLVVLVVSF